VALDPATQLGGVRRLRLERGAARLERLRVDGRAGSGVALRVGVTD
jgi:hypothetical protein